MSDFTPAERALLDRATVPAMRSGLARNIVAAANGAAPPPRRGSRGSWRRHGRILLGAGALVVASATAAATGLLDKLPIRIPGITRVAEAPAAKPKPVVRAEKPRVAPGEAVSLAAITPAPVPLIDPTPTPQEVLRERRAARIAAGLPVRPTLMQRAIAEKLRGLPPAQRRAALAEWRRIKALPPAERKIAVAKVRADFLARHPQMAKRFEQRLEARNIAAADDKPSPVAPAAPLATQPPQGRSLTPDQRLERRQRWQAMTPDPRAARREQLREWRMQRRGRRLQTGEGSAPPER